MSSTTELIKSKLNVVDVIGGYLKLQKAGANFKANCPFHSEKTPSFFISPSRDNWHCFGCNKGGDIFNFVMEIEGLDFADALKILAQKAGVKIESLNKDYDSERSWLLKIMEESKNFYLNEAEKNLDVKNYLVRRGLTEETIKNFEIGFSPDGWKNLYNFLLSRKYSPDLMEKTGMVIKKQDDPSKQATIYDRFRGRIMFPVKNPAGQVIGFSGRIFIEKEGDTSGKYINNPQTALYDKSRVLFGFDKAKTGIRKEDLCILVEGQMDVIMSHQAGVVNTVAVSGTALTQEHLQAIKRLTENVAVAFDKDDAGVRASKRGIDMALADGFEVRAIIIPSGKDPADTIKENPEIWRGAVKSSKHVIDFYLESSKDHKDIKESILPYVKLIPDEIKKAFWIKKISEKFGIKEESVWLELEKIKVENTVNIPVKQELAVEQKNRLGFLKDFVAGFINWQKNTTDPELKKELEKYSNKYGAGRDDKDIAKKTFEVERHYEDSVPLAEEFKKIIRETEKEEMKQQLEQITSDIYKLELSKPQTNETDSENKFDELLNKFRDLTKKLNEFK